MNRAACRQPECVSCTPSAKAQACVRSAPELARRAALGDFDHDVIAWLHEGLRRHVVEGEQVEVALRLDRASRTRARDTALRHAAALLRLGDEDGLWTVAGRLVQAIVRQQRKRDTAVTPLEIAVAAALGSGVRVPTTQRQVYSIIAD